MDASEARAQQFDRPARPPAATDDAGFTPASISPVIAMAELDLETDGAALHRGAALCAVADIESALADLPAGQAGIRLYGRPTLLPMLVAKGPIGRIAAQVLGSSAIPVRAILFDKTAAANWALGWHQDRTVAVAARVAVPEYGPWSVKAGVQHVEPPFAVIERMVTLRVHLDPVPADNAPLLIARGSHRFGRVPESEIAALVAGCETCACLADRGDVWVYRTPVVHASAPSTQQTGRRVVQIDYAADALAGGLEWAGL